MPYPKDHATRTRARITEAARRLFNLHGFNGVSIDAIMAEAGLTRGVFYAHFSSKHGREAAWHETFGIDPARRDRAMAWRAAALAQVALCVGGMVLARTLPDSSLANEVRQAARAAAIREGGLRMEAA